MFNLKETDNIFQDIFSPLSSRENERFFYKLIGTPENETEYFNNIFNLDNRLNNATGYYTKLENGVPLDMNILQPIVTLVRNSFKFKDLTQKEFVFKKAFQNFKEKCNVPQETLKQLELEFVNICQKWYTDTIKTKTVNFDMAVNFSVKMATWLSEIFPKVQNGALKQSETISKVLFYGAIKPHEIIFLELLFNIGCDILYINTENVIVNGIGVERKYEKFSPLPEFPKQETVVAYQTNALKAETEVNDNYYDEQSAVRHWQLQSYSIKNVPLKTTYDELFTLWTVDSNMRPRF